MWAKRQSQWHTPSTAFWHPPPNSARFSYATEGALFISAQMSSNVVSALRKVWVLNMTVEAAQRQSTHVNMRRIHPGLKKKSSVSIQMIVVLFVLVWTLLAVINNMPCFIWVVCNKLTTVWAPTKKLLVSWQFSGHHGVTKYGNGWRKDVENQCLEFELVVHYKSSGSWKLSESTTAHGHHMDGWLICARLCIWPEIYPWMNKVYCYCCYY